MNCIGLRKSLPLRAAALLCTAAAVLSAAALPLCSAAEVDAGDTPEERAVAVTAVADGDCTIELPDGTVRGAHLSDGLLTVAAKGVTLLSGSFKFDE